MNAQELKKLLKSLVRECVNEIMNEKYIELVVENKLKESVIAKPNPQQPQSNLLDLKESLMNSEKPKEQAPKPRSIPKSFIEGLGLNQNDPLASIFEDTASRIDESETNKKYIKGENEALSEAEMEKAGILNKDWTRYITNEHK